MQQCSRGMRYSLPGQEWSRAARIKNRFTSELLWGCRRQGRGSRGSKHTPEHPHTHTDTHAVQTAAPSVSIVVIIIFVFIASLAVNVTLSTLCHVLPRCLPIALLPASLQFPPLSSFPLSLCGSFSFFRWCWKFKLKSFACCLRNKFSVLLYALTKWFRVWNECVSECECCKKRVHSHNSIEHCRRFWRVLNYSADRQLRPTGWPALKPNKCKYLCGGRRRGRYCCSCFLYTVCVCVCGWANKSLGWPVTQSVSQSVRHAVSQKPKSATKLKSMHGQLHLAASRPLLPQPLPLLASSRPQQIQHRPEPTSPEQPRQAAATACSYLWHILQFCGFHLQN